MALTRRFLTALGIESDKIDEIITAHTDSTDALKQQRDEYKAEAEKNKDDAEKLEAVQKELDDLKASNKDNDSYKEKYEKEKSDFEAFKSDLATKEAAAKKTAAYRALLKEAGVSEKHLDAVLKASDLSGIELDDKGTIKDSDKATEAIRKEWSDFIVQDGSQGAASHNPPEGSGEQHHGSGRAAQIAAQYQAEHYGSVGNGTGAGNGSDGAANGNS